MRSLAGRLADRLLSTLAPTADVNAAACSYRYSGCSLCSSTKSRKYDIYVCADGTTRRVDYTCGSC